MFPKPKYNIGDIVRVADNYNPDEIAMIVGMRLRYYDHMRKHVWYYELADKMSVPVITKEWLEDEELATAHARTRTQKWHIDGGEVPIRPAMACWNCNEIRISDNMDCPYCLAGDNEIDAVASAIEMAQSLNLDDAVRTIAKSGYNHDNGPNWYGKWEELNVSATFGAGTNSASVTKLYRASEYGRHIEEFHNGPWVHRLIRNAEAIRAKNEVQARAAEVDLVKRENAKFQEIDF